MFKRKTRSRLITENPQDQREELLFGLKLKLEMLSEFNDVFKNDPDQQMQQQLMIMKNDIRKTIKQLIQEGTSLPDIYNKFGALMFRAKLLESQDIINRLTQSKEKSIVDLVNEDLILEQRLDAINNVQAQQQRQAIEARKQGIFIQPGQQNQRQALQNLMANMLLQRFGNQPPPPQLNQQFNPPGQGGQPPQPPPGQGGNQPPRQPPPGFNNQPPRRPPPPIQQRPPIQQQMAQQPQIRQPLRPQPQRDSGRKAPRGESPQMQQQQQQQQPPVQQQPKKEEFFMEGYDPNQYQNQQQVFVMPKKKAPKTRKTKSQVRSPSPTPDFNRSLNIINQREDKNNAVMTDIEHEPLGIAKDSDELNEMIAELGYKLDAGFDIRLRLPSKSRSRSRPKLPPKITPKQLREQALEEDFNNLTELVYNTDLLVFDQQTLDIIQQYAQIAKKLASEFSNQRKKEIRIQNYQQLVNTLSESLGQLFRNYIAQLSQNGLLQEQIQKVQDERDQFLAELEIKANQNKINIPRLVDQIVEAHIEMMQYLEGQRIANDQQQQPDQQQSDQQEEIKEQKPIDPDADRKFRKERAQQKYEEFKQYFKQGDFARAFDLLVDAQLNNYIAEKNIVNLVKRFKDKLPKNDFVNDAFHYYDQGSFNLQQLRDYLQPHLTREAIININSLLDQGNVAQASQMTQQQFQMGNILNTEMPEILNRIITILNDDFLNKAVDAYNVGFIDLNTLFEEIANTINKQQQQTEQQQTEADASMQQEEEKKEAPKRGRSKTVRRDNQQPDDKKSQSRSAQRGINQQEKDFVKDLIKKKETIFALSQIVKGLQGHIKYEEQRRKKQEYEGFYFDTSTKGIRTIIDLVFADLPQNYQQEYTQIIENSTGKDRNQRLIQFFERIIADYKNQPR